MQISNNFDIRLDVVFFSFFLWIKGPPHLWKKFYIQAQTSKLLKGMEREGKNFIFFFFRILPLFMKTKAPYSNSGPAGHFSDTPFALKVQTKNFGDVNCFIMDQNCHLVTYCHKMWKSLSREARGVDDL